MCGSGLPCSASKIRPDYFLQAPERSRSPSRHGFDGFLLRCVSCKRFGPHLGPVRAPSGRTKTSKSIEPSSILAFSAFLNLAHFGGPLEGLLGPSWGQILGRTGDWRTLAPALCGRPGPEFRVSVLIPAFLACFWPYFRYPDLFSRQHPRSRVRLVLVLLESSTQQPPPGAKNIYEIH